jgi:predicted Fe-Mo cluster-binding NifX family protein
MQMGRVKLALATNGSKGLGDEIADAFALAKTFTIATVEGNKVHFEVLKNPAETLSYGRGRRVVQMLKEKGVDIVVASEFGPGASALLEQSRIRKVVVRAGTVVGDIIRERLYKKG